MMQRWAFTDVTDRFGTKTEWAGWQSRQNGELVLSMSSWWQDKGLPSLFCDNAVAVTAEER